ncbi:MAG: hypothetical protein PVF95_06340 [bacterium]|jgi:hypothetical protein
MSRKWPDERAVVAGLLFTVFFLAGCDELELKSAWRDREIVIDGDATDWRGLTTYVEEGNIAVAVANDAEDLFICLHSPTREIAGQIVMSGLTVWFDPEGGFDRRFGVHCPVGGYMPRRGGRETMDRDEMKDTIDGMVDEAANLIELLGPDNTVYGTYAAGDIEGLEIALGYVSGRIIYELRLPLERTEERPYALGVNWEKKVGIGFLTPEIDMEAIGEGMSGEMGERPPGGGGGRGGPGGGMPVGPGGGAPPGMKGGTPEFIELLCRAELALPSE